MTREESVKQKAQEFASRGEFSPTLTECFIAGAEWEHNRFMEMACGWLRNNIDFYVETNYGEDFRVDIEQLLKDIRKAMEE